MSNILLGLAMLAFAGISLWDGARITASFRIPGSFDLVGPDRYLTGVALLIGVLGLAVLAQGVLQQRLQPTASEPQTATGDSTLSQRHFVLIGLLILYAVLIPVLGYILATLLFFVATFRVMGVSTWVYTILWSLVGTATFVVSFLTVANMSLPHGLLGIALP